MSSLRRGWEFEKIDGVIFDLQRSFLACVAVVFGFNLDMGSKQYTGLDPYGGCAQGCF